MYSTWRSDESRGYWDLHRRCLKAPALSVEERWNDRWECEALGERPRNEGAGERRGSPLVLGLVDKESLEGRYGRVLAIVGGRGRLRKLRGVETDAPRKKGRGTCLCAVKSSSFSGVRSRINAEPAQIWWFRGHFRKRAISTAGGDRAITESSEIGIRVL